MFCGPHHGRSRRYEGDDAQERRESEFLSFVERMATIVLVCVGIWLFTGAGYFWPVWVIAFAAVKIGVHARRTYGRSDSPYSDLVR